MPTLTTPSREGLAFGSVRTCTHCDAKSHLAYPRISPSKLGVFALPDYCPRCCWRLLRMRFAKPYFFPPAAVLNRLDAHQKQMARVALEDGNLPAFFGGCADATELLDVKSLSCHHEDTDLHLFGKPDFMFTLADGTTGIVDAKTAKAKQEGSPLFYSYRLQVNFYAMLAEMAEQPYTISKGGLLYFEFDGMSDDEIRENFSDTHMWTKFKPQYVEVDLDPETIVVPVLKTVRDLLDLSEAPKSRKGCGDCDLLGVYANLLSDNDVVTDSDLRYLTASERSCLLARQRYLQMTDRATLRSKLMTGLISASNPHGVVRNWGWDADAVVVEG